MAYLYFCSHFVNRKPIDSELNKEKGLLAALNLKIAEMASIERPFHIPEKTTMYGMSRKNKSLKTEHRETELKYRFRSTTRMSSVLGSP